MGHQPDQNRGGGSVIPQNEASNGDDDLQDWDLAFEQMPKARIRQEIAMEHARGLVWEWFFQPIDSTNFWDPNVSNRSESPEPVGPPICIRIAKKICADLPIGFDEPTEDVLSKLSAHVLEIMALGITIGDEVRS